MSNGDTRAISICDHYKNEDNSLRVAMYYFGTADVDILASHVFCYLSYLQEITPDVHMYKILLPFSKHLNVSVVERILLPLLGERNRSPSFDAITFVISRSVKPTVSNDFD